MVKGVLGGNLQHRIHWALELRVSLVIVPVCQAHGVQVADLYVIVKTEQIGGESGGVSIWDKLVSILFPFVIQRVNRRLCLAEWSEDALRS